MKINPATTVKTGDTLELRVRVLDIKASDHKWYGLNDMMTVDLISPAGDLPAGLRFQVRRPHDGTADVRSVSRKGKRPLDVLPKPTPEMSKGELLALADARNIDVPDKVTKAQLLELLSK
jgi:hypothetical protein